MSVFYADQVDEFWVPESDECWLCRQPIFAVLGQLPAVCWMGRTGTIGLHRGCAERLGVNLIKDAREAELAAGCFSTRRTARVARGALVASEMSR